jgi:hypothetical protein
MEHCISRNLISGAKKYGPARKDQTDIYKEQPSGLKSPLGNLEWMSQSVNSKELSRELCLQSRQKIVDVRSVLYVHPHHFWLSAAAPLPDRHAFFYDL